MNDAAQDTAPADEAVIVTLSEDMDIRSADSLRDTLLEALDDGRPITLEANAVARADTAGLQVLCAFCRDAADRGVAVSWEAPSEPLRDSARLLGVTEHLGLQENS